MAETVFTRVFDHAVPDHRALQGRGLRWTYGELRRDTERLAAGLERQGLVAGDRVAVVADSHPVTLVVWMAGARAGFVTSVVNSLFTRHELTDLLARLRPAALFVDDAHRERVATALDDAGLTTPVFAVEPTGAPSATAGVNRQASWDTLLAQEPTAAAHPDPLEPVEIAFTSGTTSAPKGAVFTHASHLYSVEAWRNHVGLTASDVAFTILPLFHAGGMRNASLATLFAGGEVVIEPRFSASSFWDRMSEVGATFVIVVETVIAILLQRGAIPANHSIRIIGGAGQPDLVDQLESALGVRSIQNYGLTEFGSVSAIPTDIDRSQLSAKRHDAPDAHYVGAPLGAETLLRVVDEAGRPVAVGGRGEIQVRTPGRFVEYFENPAATAAAAADDGWFRTGDLGYLDNDGHLYFVERIKEIIRRGGENLAPREVEDVLCRHEAVVEAAVYAVPDRIRIEEVKALVVVNRDTDPQDLWNWCVKDLADFKVPRFIEFRHTIPRNNTGRVLKRELRLEPVTGAGVTYDRTTGHPVEKEQPT